MSIKCRGAILLALLSSVLFFSLLMVGSSDSEGQSAARKLKELRVEFSSNLYRVFFFAFTGRRFILRHAFTKKTPKTPRREIDVAIMRMTDYLQRKGGQS